MANPIEINQQVNPNLLQGSKQLVFEGLEIAAEQVVATKPRLSRQEIAQFVKNQPKLFGGKEDSKYVRFTGELLIPRWMPLSQKRKKELEAEEHGQQAIKSRTKRRPSQIVWDQIQSIEHAIGASVSILKRYRPSNEEQEGEEQVIVSTESTKTVIQRVEEIRTFTETLMSGFESGEITVDNLREYSEETYNVLENAGFLKSRVANRQAAVDQLLKAVALDSLDRFNPTVARMRLASNLVKWTIELFVGDLIISKRERLLLALLQERTLERFYIDEVIKKTELFLNLDIEDPSIEDQKNQLYKTVLELFRHNTIKTAPYRVPSFRFLFGSFGIPKIRSSGLKYIFANMFGPQSEEPILDVEQIEADFQSKESTAQARFRTRLRNGVDGMLDALKQGEDKFKEYEEVIPSLVTKNNDPKAEEFYTV